MNGDIGNMLSVIHGLSEDRFRTDDEYIVDDETMFRLETISKTATEIARMVRAKRGKPQPSPRAEQVIQLLSERPRTFAELCDELYTPECPRRRHAPTWTGSSGD